MSESTSAKSFDVSGIPDPDVRRVLRAMHTEFAETLARQQMEIQALLEMMIEKHVGSMGEFKRHLMKLQQGTSRSERIQTQIAAVTGETPRPTRYTI
jgi:hypothetical protein